MTWLIDTDVMSQPAKRNGDPRVVAWLEREKDQHTSAVVIAQLAYWVRSKKGRQRQALQAWLTRLVDAMHGRIYGQDFRRPGLKVFNPFKDLPNP